MISTNKLGENIMTKGGRIFAGIVGLAGAGLFLIGAFVVWFFTPSPALNITLTLIVAVLAFVSAILTLTDKSFGCIFLLILGIVMFVEPLLVNVFGLYSPQYITSYMWVDAILILFAGIVGTAVGSE